MKECVVSLHFLVQILKTIQYASVPALQEMIEHDYVLESCLLRNCAVSDECEQRPLSFIHVVKLYPEMVLQQVIYDLRTHYVTTRERFRALRLPFLAFMSQCFSCSFAVQQLFC